MDKAVAKKVFFLKKKKFKILLLLVAIYNIGNQTYIGMRI